MKINKQSLLFLLQQGKLAEAHDGLKAAHPDKPEEELYISLGNTCNEANFYSGALRCYMRCIELNPNHALAHVKAGKANLDIGNVNKSLMHTKRATEIDRLNPEVQFIAGTILRRLEKFKMAIHFFMLSIKIKPGNAMAHCLLGNCFHSIGNLEHAIHHYKISLKCDSKTSESLMWLSSIYQLYGDFERALKYSEKAVEAHPDSSVQLSARANLLSFTGDKKASYNIVRKLIDTDNYIPLTLNIYSDLLPEFGSTEEFISLSEAMFDINSISISDKRLLHYALGKTHDRIQDYKSAFNHYKSANDAYGFKYDINSHKQLFDRLINVYNKEFISRLPVNPDRSSQPIFIIGMPRSGTSLIEQILSRHSDVYAAGELIYITDIINNLSGQKATTDIHLEIIHDLNEGDIQAIANTYQDRINKLSNNSPRSVDKMPTNFMYLGLIAQMFPNAKIIHCRRDPLDTCLSIYFQNFGASHPYSNNLDDIAHVYTEYHRLMEHWKKSLDLHILDLEYEDVVNNLDDNVKILLDFCNLPWQEDCVEFHKSDRHVSTASFDQVNKPIYRDSLKRWQNYEEQLSNVKEILHPIISDKPN